MGRNVDDNGIPLVALVTPVVAGGAVGTSAGASNVFKPKASTAITAGTAVSFWTPAAGKKPRVRGFALSTSAAGSIKIKVGANSGASVEVFRTPALAAGGFFQLGDDDMGQGILAAAANDQVWIDAPTGNVEGTLWGTEE